MIIHVVAPDSHALPSVTELSETSITFPKTP